jgi:thiazole synthase
MVTDILKLYGQDFSSRLLLGTAAYPSPTLMQESIMAVNPAMITVALRRSSHYGAASGQGFWALLQAMSVPILPNTAGCLSVQEAITTAQMAREVFETDWIKLELIGDDATLQPDVFQLVEAAKGLSHDGFKVWPYCTEDLIVGRRLLDVGCEALMPWGAPIGTGLGITHEYALRVLRERLPEIPLIVDAGLGLPSHAAKVMEWGFDGVLLNSAVSRSGHPVQMAKAFDLSIQAGRMAYLSTPITPREQAMASTPTVGMPFWHQE